MPSDTLLLGGEGNRIWVKSGLTGRREDSADIMDVMFGIVKSGKIWKIKQRLRKIDGLVLAKLALTDEFAQKKKQTSRSKGNY